MDDNQKQEKFKRLEALKPELAKTNALETLKPFGGFNIINATIENVKAMSPSANKALKDTFLKYEENSGQRQALKNRLRMMVDALNDSETSGQVFVYFQNKLQKTEQLFDENLSEAMEKSEELEISYRSIALFFKNAGSEKIVNLTLVNAHKSQITDLDNPQISYAVRLEIAATNNSIDLRKNYSIMVIPGYLGSNSVLDHWGELAHNNKVMMVTDFEDIEPEKAITLFEAKNHAGASKYKSNILMTTNWLIGRKGEKQYRDGNPLYIPPSVTLAGKMYAGNIAQPIAGVNFGILEGVDGAKFTLKLLEIGEFERLGLIPIVFDRGKVFAYSAKTLFNGDNLGLQTYSVVRVLDWISKVIMNFLNRRSFNNLDYNIIKELEGQISKFLNGITGSGLIIEDFEITKLEQDLARKDNVLLDIRIKPFFPKSFFPARSFTLSLEGTKGDDQDINWESKTNN